MALKPGSSQAASQSTLLTSPTHLTSNLQQLPPAIAPMSSRPSRTTGPRTPQSSVNPTKLTTDALRLRLQEANLTSTGRRPQLVKRLAAHIRSSSHGISEADEADQAADTSADDRTVTETVNGNSEEDPSPGNSDSSALSDSDRAWRRSRHRSRTHSHRRHHSRSPTRHRSRSRRRNSRKRHHHHHHHSRSSSRSPRRSISREGRSHTRHRHRHHRPRSHSPVRHRRYSPARHSRGRHHSSHYRSIYDRLGPTPSPSPSSSSSEDSYYYTDEIPPSSCGQPLRPSLLRRIRRGEYVNFALLLPTPPGTDPNPKRSRRSRSSSPYSRDNDHREPKPPVAKITNLDSWLRAWSRYILAVTHFYPAKAIQMIKYQDRIVTAAERYSVDGWYSYDKAFRLKLSHDPSLRWDRLDSDLWSFWCASQARPFCSRCHRYGHMQAACPAGKSAFRPSTANTKTKDGRTICLRFNHSSCPNANKCRYAHVCLKCEGGHPVSAGACERTT